MTRSRCVNNELFGPAGSLHWQFETACHRVVDVGYAGITTVIAETAPQALRASVTIRLRHSEPIRHTYIKSQLWRLHQHGFARRWARWQTAATQLVMSGVASRLFAAKHAARERIVVRFHPAYRNSSVTTWLYYRGLGSDPFELSVEEMLAPERFNDPT